MRVNKTVFFLYLTIWAVITILASTNAHAQNKPEIEINTSVLDELEQQMGKQNVPPAKQPALKRPQPKKYNSERLLTAPLYESRRPKTEEPQQQQAPITTTKPVIAQKTTKQAMGKAIPLPKRKPQRAVKTVKAVSAPDKPKPIVAKSIVKTKPSLSVQEKMVVKPDITPPIPKKRPIIQKASTSFIKEARQKYVMQSKKAIMPVAQPQKVSAEPLTPTPPKQASKHTKERHKIIDAVNKIAKQTKEPDIDVKTETVTNDITEYEVAKLDKRKKTPRPPPGKDLYHDENIHQITFPDQKSDLNKNIKKEIERTVLKYIKSNPEKRLQVRAFAKKDNGDTSSARRLSLARALSVRKFLLDQGLEPSRIDIMALGNETKTKPYDRVDFVIFDPEKDR